MAAVKIEHPAPQSTMFRSTPLVSLALGTLSSVYAQELPAVLTEEIIEGLGNNTLFTRWRPNYHFSAPAGWLNDPCAMMYDPTKDLYHLHYQWHPNHVNWGNISWGHATSKDMITWSDVGGWENDQAQSLGTGPNPDSRNSSYYGLGILTPTIAYNPARTDLDRYIQWKWPALQPPG